MRTLLLAPAEPVNTRTLHIDAKTTPAQLTVRVLDGARRHTVPAAILTVLHQIGEALVPVLMGLAIEQAITTGDLSQLFFWLLVLAADFALLSFSWRFGSRIGELGMLAVQHQLRNTVTAHLVLRGRAHTSPGIALSLATSDVNRLSEAVAIAIYPVGQLAAIIFGGTCLILISWPLGLAVLVGAPLLLWVTERTSRTLRERTSLEQESTAAAAGSAADLMAGYRVIRGVGAEAEASIRYRRASQKALASTLAARRAEATFLGGMDLATGLFLAAITTAAALTALGGSLSIGALITVIGLTQFLIEPLQGVARTTGTLWASATASAGRLLELLRDDSLDHNPVAEGMLPLNVSPAPGEIVVVATESMLMEGLLGALRNRHPEALIAPHAAHLFAGTLWENVALPGVSVAEAHAALAAAGCSELARALPFGFETNVGENGSALSGGQRQRVALARALAQNSATLVLHDPTTAVDAVTEAAIAAGLRGARGTRQTIIVTHSPALTAIADRVIYFAPGHNE